MAYISTINSTSLDTLSNNVQSESKNLNAVKYITIPSNHLNTSMIPNSTSNTAAFIPKQNITKIFIPNIKNLNNNKQNIIFYNPQSLANKNIIVSNNISSATPTILPYNTISNTPIRNIIMNSNNNIKYVNCETPQSNNKVYILQNVNKNMTPVQNLNSNNNYQTPPSNIHSNTINGMSQSNNNYSRSTNFTGSGYNDKFSQQHLGGKKSLYPTISSRGSSNVAVNTLLPNQLQSSHHHSSISSGERASKGLRHFSMKVCEKVHRKGVTTYNEVADELVAEYALSSVFSSTSYQTGNATGSSPFIDPFDSFNGMTTFDHKNIRRRVYDALNVLMAMNIISKEKKEIRWIGLPINSQQESATLLREKEQRLARIKEKQTELNKLILKQIALKTLIQRNKLSEKGVTLNSTQNESVMQNKNGSLESNSNMALVSHKGGKGISSQQPSLSLPFILINTDKSTVIDCSISNDKCEYYFNFNREFEVLDDYQIMKKLGLTYGLNDEALSASLQKYERGKFVVSPKIEQIIDPATLNSILANVPLSLQPYVKEMAGYGDRSPENLQGPLCSQISVLNQRNNGIFSSLQPSSGIEMPSSSFSTFNFTSNHNSINTSYNNSNSFSALLNDTVFSNTDGKNSTNYVHHVKTEFIDNNMNTTNTTELNYQNLTFNNNINVAPKNVSYPNAQSNHSNSLATNTINNATLNNAKSLPPTSLATLQFNNLLSQRALQIQKKVRAELLHNNTNKPENQNFSDKENIQHNYRKNIDNVVSGICANRDRISSTSTSDIFSSEDSMQSSNSQSTNSY